MNLTLKAYELDQSDLKKLYEVVDSKNIGYLLSPMHDQKWQLSKSGKTLSILQGDKICKSFRVSRCNFLLKERE